MVLLPAENILHELQALPMHLESQDILDLIKTSLPTDVHHGPLLEQYSHHPDADSRYSVVDGLLLQDGLLCVPDNAHLKQMILDECHDQSAAGHFGIAKTYDLVARTFVWPGMR
ncbi:hypothetical protein BGZ50_001281, partial [Haplosporangium sp. Z 11]